MYRPELEAPKLHTGRIMRQPRPMDLRALEDRLENWARAQRSGGSSGACIGSAEGMYRFPGVLYREQRSNLPEIDYADAATVNLVWRSLMDVDKKVLQMHYVWRAPSSFICRRLKLKQGRGHEHIWDFALYHAQSTIWDRLERDLVNDKNRAYNPRQLITESGSAE